MGARDRGHGPTKSIIKETDYRAGDMYGPCVNNCQVLGRNQFSLPSAVTMSSVSYHPSRADEIRHGSHWRCFAYLSSCLGAWASQQVAVGTEMETLATYTVAVPSLPPPSGTIRWEWRVGGLDIGCRGTKKISRERFQPLGPHQHTQHKKTTYIPFRLLGQPDLLLS